jgi:hypothetical protein
MRWRRRSGWTWRQNSSTEPASISAWGDRIGREGRRLDHGVAVVVLEGFAGDAVGAVAQPALGVADELRRHVLELERRHRGGEAGLRRFEGSGGRCAATIILPPPVQRIERAAEAAHQRARGIREQLVQPVEIGAGDQQVVLEVGGQRQRQGGLR